MRTLLPYLVYPSCLITAVGAAWLGIRAQLNSGLLLAGISLTVAMVLLVLQRLLPHRRDWIVTPRTFGLDLLHLIFSTSLTSEAVRALLLAGGTLMGGWASGAIGLGLWPSGWPWLVQLALALVVAEFGYYWAHRLSHELEALWRLHALHHSSRLLYLFSGSRTHPLGVTLNYTAMLLPLIVLGAPLETLALFTVFTGTNGMLQHANVRMHTRALNRVFATADLHRWHHSVHPSEGNANYGSNLVLFDALFVTLRLPEPDTSPDEVGISGGSRFPETFAGQLASPFTYKRWAS